MAEGKHLRSLPVRETEIKIMRYYYVCIRMDNMKEKQIRPSVGKHVDNLDLSHTAGVKWYQHFRKTVWQFVKILNIFLPND